MFTKRNLPVVAGLGLAVLCACRCPSGNDCYRGAAVKVAPRNVIFVGFDGLAGNLIERAKTPTMDRLMREGAWTLASRSILPSSSACNWHSLFTASASEQHGFKAWDSREPAFPPMEVGENGRYPDIFFLLRKARPEAEIGLAYEWGGIAHCVDTNACRTVAVGKTDVLTDASCAYIREKKPDFLAVCYNDPDADGHKNGWGSAEYIAAVERLDACLDRILRAVADAGILEETVVVVSSDHGGVNRTHGGATAGEMNRPVFIVGKGVVRGRHLSFPGTIYDTGATLAALLNICPARSWIGRPYDEAFEERPAECPSSVRHGASEVPAFAQGAEEMGPILVHPEIRRNPKLKGHLDEFTLKDVTDAYKAEFEANADWLKLGFHSLQEFPDYPWINATYGDVKKLFDMIHGEIVRFAGERSFARACVPHWCPMSREGVRALKDCGIRVMECSVGPRYRYDDKPERLPYGHAFRLLQNRQPETGFYWRESRNTAISASICSYNHIPEEQSAQTALSFGYIYDRDTGMNFKHMFCDAPCLNLCTLETLKADIARVLGKEYLIFSNHEQYFFKGYLAYQPEYADKIRLMCKTMHENGYQFILMEELVE